MAIDGAVSPTRQRRQICRILPDLLRTLRADRVGRHGRVGVLRLTLFLLNFAIPAWVGASELIATSGVGHFPRATPAAKRLSISAPTLPRPSQQGLFSARRHQCTQVCLLVLCPFGDRKKRAGIKNLPIIDRDGDAFTGI